MDEINEYETFFDDIKDVNGTLRITIPFKLALGLGLKQGDNLKVMIKKVA